MIKNILIIIGLLINLNLISGEIKGKVSKVIDGDTLILIDDDIQYIKRDRVVIKQQGKYKIRLANIDAPEKSQRFGKQSKQYLSKLIGESRIVVRFHQIDIYGRIVGVVYLVNSIGIVSYESVNECMVRDGYAWWYKGYSKRIQYGQLEEEARKKKLGIWREERNEKPWEYRKKNK